VKNLGESNGRKKTVVEEIKELFNLSPKIHYKKNQNTMQILLRSKALFGFMKENGAHVKRNGAGGELSLGIIINM